MRTLEHALDRAYRLCGAIAAGFVVVIAVLIISEVILRNFGMSIPGVIELATFSLLSATFFALAQTLRCNEHVRITVVLAFLSPGIRRWVEFWCLGVSAIVFSILGWHTMLMAVDSFRFNENSDGVLGIPLWIPQTIMLIGTVMISLVFIEEMAKILCGRMPVYVTDAAENPELEGVFEFDPATVPSTDKTGA